MVVCHGYHTSAVAVVCHGYHTYAVAVVPFSFETDKLEYQLQSKITVL